MGRPGVLQGVVVLLGQLPMVVDLRLAPRSSPILPADALFLTNNLIRSGSLVSVSRLLADSLSIVLAGDSTIAELVSL